MRICLVSEYYYPLLGGITEHIYHFSKQCLNRGHDVTLLTSHAGEIDPTLIPRGLKMHRVGRSFPIQSNDSFARVTLSFDLGRQVRSFFRKESFDIVNVHAALTPTLPLLAIRYQTAPTIGTIHTDFGRIRFYEMFRKPCQEILDQHDGIIAVSPICVESMKRYFNFEATVIPNGVDIDWYAEGKPMTGTKDGTFTILFLGRLDPRNGLDTLIEAFTLLRTRGRKARLIIAGDGPLLNHYKKLIPQDWQSDVHFVGAVNKERKNYLASADVFCYPARKGSFGITILEAMAAGLPVVASNIRGFADLLRNGQDGILVEQRNCEALANAFENLAKDSALRRHFSENGRRRALDFSWTKVSGQILDYYSGRLAAKPQRLSA